MKVNGKIIYISPLKSGTNKNGEEWKSLDFVISYTDNGYDKKSLFNFFGKNKIEAANLNIGDDVEVTFDVSAREYEGKWYNNVNAHIVTKLNSNILPNKNRSDIFANSNIDTYDLPF